MNQAAHVDEKQARAVAEAARETDWTKPSFGKHLFLGDYRLDLIHPHPRPDPARAEAGRQFLERLGEFCATVAGG